MEKPVVPADGLAIKKSGYFVWMGVTFCTAQ